MTRSLVAADIDIFARTIYGEARGEDQASRISVGHAIINRWRSTTGQWSKDDTLATTCLRPWQFSCWNEGDPNLVRMMAATLNAKLFRTCYIAALEALNTKDTTLGARHYHTAAMGWPRAWGRKKIPCYETGGHLFYNDVL